MSEVFYDLNGKTIVLLYSINIEVERNDLRSVLLSGIYDNPS